MSQQMTRAQRLLVAYILFKLSQPRVIQQVSKYYGGGGPTSIADLATKDHHLLDGLSDDDHTQYLPLTGIRPMTGNLKVEAPANADALIIGSPTEEGGDFRIYRDSSGNYAMYVDADKTSGLVGTKFYASMSAGADHIIFGRVYRYGAYQGGFYAYDNPVGYNTYVWVGASRNNPAFQSGTITKEGGDILIYRDTIGTVAFHVDADDCTTIPFAGDITMLDGKNIAVDTVTGTKIGTATNQKLGFYNAAPVVQQAHIADADGTLADITTKFNTLLSYVEALGLLAAA